MAKKATKDVQEVEEAPLDANFVEQAEYIPIESFEALHALHPDEESIVRRLSVSGAKLLVGPRGCGKTTLMLKAYYGLLQDDSSRTFPVYVNFKLSLKLEPLYQNTPNASFWFRSWLILKIYEGMHQVFGMSEYRLPPMFPSKSEVSAMISSIEGGRINSTVSPDYLNVEGLSSSIGQLLVENEMVRCVLLLDDAAHAFSPKQQEDFFEFFRQIKSREISPKAAIYPGITTHSPTFHVGHDAEQIDAWVRPNAQSYLPFMSALATKRFGGELPLSLRESADALEFLAYASFGIPRSFLNMLRTLYHDDGQKNSGGTLDRRKLLEVSKQSRESAHTVYDSLAFKLPAYKEFVATGREVYSAIISTMKNFNRDREDVDQAFEIGIKRPIPPEIEKVLGFYQYAGLLMPSGQNSRGEKGVFEIYMVHFGDLITENAMIGRRAKSISAYVKAFGTQTHQAWPRISTERLVKNRPSMFRLSLPNCQNCGAERPSEEARFCANCGAQLKTASLYDELTKQEISVLPLSLRMVKRIRENSNIKTIRDILIDTNRANLRSIPLIGPVRAARIASYAEEYVA